jgi:hypothetical protein
VVLLLVDYVGFVPEISPMLDAELLFRYEDEDLDFEDIVTLFQQIYDTKAYTWLQGSYGTNASPSDGGRLH